MNGTFTSTNITDWSVRNPMRGPQDRVNGALNGHVTPRWRAIGLL